MSHVYLVRFTAPCTPEEALRSLTGNLNFTGLDLPLESDVEILPIDQGSARGYTAVRWLDERAELDSLKRAAVEALEVQALQAAQVF